MGALKREIGDLKRFEEILIILAEEGFGHVLQRINLFRHVPGLRRLTHDKVPPPERVRKTFERLGPTFIKFGQILAQRPDVVPEAYIKELEKLEDAVPEFDPEIAKDIIEEDLGPLHETFAEFKDEPLAAASIAQVHRATLHDGTEVVVKVRRPGIKEQMQKDLDILQFLARVGAKHVKTLEQMHLGKVAKEFARWTTDELDLKQEGRNANIIRDNLQDEKRLKIPEIYMEHSSERVLVMEYVEGVKSNDVEALEELDINASEVAHTAVRAGLKQVIRDGFFHADPHPSNFLISPDGDLIYVDFGMVGKFSKTMRRNLGLLVLHAVNEDVDGAIETIKRIGTVDDDADIDGLRDDLEEIMTVLSHTTIGQQSITLSLLDMTRRAHRRGVTMPPSITIMGKALLTMEGIGLTIYPEFKLGDEYKRVVRKLLWKQNNPREIGRTLITDMIQNRDLFARMPSKIDNLMEGISNPEVKTTVKIERPGTMRAILAGAIILSASIMLIDALPADKILNIAVGQTVIAAILVLWAIKALK